VLGTVIVRVRVKDGHLVNSTVRVLVTLGLWMSAVVVFAGGGGVWDRYPGENVLYSGEVG